VLNKYIDLRKRQLAIEGLLKNMSVIKIIKMLAANFAEG